MKHVSLLLLLGLFVFVVNAQENEYQKFGVKTKNHSIPAGLKVGDKAPGFTAKDQNGNTLILSKILQDKPVVLFFYRGYWCPYCNKYLKRYADSLDMLQKNRVEVIAVTPEGPDKINKTMKKTGIDIHIISDKNEDIMKAYNVNFKVTEKYQNKIKEGFSVDIAKSNNQNEAQLPVPATYIINKDGEIVARQFDVNYSNRASVKWMMENLPGGN